MLSSVASRCVVLSPRSRGGALYPRGLTVSSAKPKVILLGGPSGVGKSKLAVDLALKLDGEIISADSVQVYKGYNIGANKLPVDKRKGVPHHLLDIVEPSEAYNVAQFATEAHNATKDILSRGKVPLVVGGSSFYLQWYACGPFGSAPPQTPEEKIEINERVRRWGWDTALARLMEVDPESAKSISTNQFSRLARSLQVYEKTGKPFSSFKSTSSIWDAEYDFRPIYMTPFNRLFLKKSVNFRVEMMLKEGLFQEVLSTLLNSKNISFTAYSPIGYKHVYDFLRAGDIRVGPFSRMIDAFQASTRQFIGDQMAIFRSYKHYYFMEDPDVQSIVSVMDMSTDDFKRELDGPMQKHLKGPLSRQEEKENNHFNTERCIFMTPAIEAAFLESLLSNPDFLPATNILQQMPPHTNLD